MCGVIVSKTNNNKTALINIRRQYLQERLVGDNTKKITTTEEWSSFKRNMKIQKEMIDEQRS